MFRKVSQTPDPNRWPYIGEWWKHTASHPGCDSLEEFLGITGMRWSAESDSVSVEDHLDMLNRAFMRRSYLTDPQRIFAIQESLRGKAYEWIISVKNWIRASGRTTDEVIEYLKITFYDPVKEFDRYRSLCTIYQLKDEMPKDFAQRVRRLMISVNHPEIMTLAFAALVGRCTNQDLANEVKGMRKFYHVYDYFITCTERRYAGTGGLFNIENAATATDFGLSFSGIKRGRDDNHNDDVDLLKPVSMSDFASKFCDWCNKYGHSTTDCLIRSTVKKPKPLGEELICTSVNPVTSSELHAQIQSRLESTGKPVGEQQVVHNKINEPTSGVVSSLTLPRDSSFAGLPGFDLDNSAVTGGLFPYSNSQFDNFRRIDHLNCRIFHKDSVSDSDGPKKRQSSISNDSLKGIVSRGVLLDFAAWAEDHDVAHDVVNGRGITLVELLKVAKWHNIQFQVGDVILVRSGWLKKYVQCGEVRQRRHDGKDLEKPMLIGIEQDDHTKEWLHDQQVLLIGSDQPVFDDDDLSTCPWNVKVCELLNLEDLAMKCKNMGKYSFLFSSALSFSTEHSSIATAFAIL
ncbi:hypothetical protein V1514DRAFT_334058 [Lipomyces japonicus]|uniref:uncharacterized protein n=1 Tax=Lipomyces japonicus TaxID=56871 RepID=UPI0034CF4CDE